MTVPCSCLRQVSRVRSVEEGFKRIKSRTCSSGCPGQVRPGYHCLNTVRVGAGLLAIQATRCISCTALSFIASKPAPTGPRHRSTAMTTAEVVDQALGRSIFGRRLFAAGQAVVDAL